MSETAVLPLPGMPVPEELHRVEPQGRVVVRRGGRALFVHDSDDVGMRNLAVVAVTDAGVPVREAARCFGITPTYVSMLRGRAHDEGSAGLVKPMGRPPELNARQREQTRRWAGRGWTQQRIADRLGISRPRIGETSSTTPRPASPATPAPSPTRSNLNSERPPNSGALGPVDPYHLCPLALRAAFPPSQTGRYSCDYCGHSVTMGLAPFK